MSDADTAADRVDLLENERWKREYYFKHALATKQTFAEVREAKDQHVPSSSDFKSKTPWDLQVEQFHILRRAVPGDDRPFRKQGFFSEKLVEDIASDPHSTVMRILSEDDYKMPDTIFKLSSNCSPRAVFRQILTGEQYVLRGAMQPVPVKLPDVRKIP